MDHRLNATLEEWPTGPQNNGKSQHQPNPVLRGGLEPLQAITCNGQACHENCEWQRPDEALLEISQFLAFSIRKAWHYRLERHATFGTDA